MPIALRRYSLPSVNKVVVSIKFLRRGLGMITLTGSSVLPIRAMRYASNSSSVTSVLAFPQVEPACFSRLSRCHSSSPASPFRFLFSALRAAAKRSWSSSISPSPRPCFFLEDASSCRRSVSRSRDETSSVDEDEDAALPNEGASLRSCCAEDALLASIPASPVQ